MQVHLHAILGSLLFIVTGSTILLGVGFFAYLTQQPWYPQFFLRNVYRYTTPLLIFASLFLLDVAVLVGLMLTG